MKNVFPKSICWYRQERFGGIAISASKTFFLNKSAYKILSLCNGKNSTHDIYDLFIKNLDLDEEKTRKKNIDNILEEFEVNKLIALKNFFSEDKEKDTKKQKMKQSSALSLGNEKENPWLYELKMPTEVAWRITSKCNLRCIHCSVAETFKDSNIEDLLKIANILKKNIHTVIITGGEPLLLGPDLFTILDVLKKLPGLALETNCTLISPKIAEILSEYINSVQTSIYGTDPNTHDGITTVRGSFQKMMQGVNFLKEEGIQLHFNSVIFKDNIERMKKIADFALKYADTIKFNPLDPWGRGREINKVLTPQQYKEVAKVIEELRKKYGEEKILSHVPYFDMKNQFVKTGSVQSKCCAGVTYLVINSDGSVQPCERLPIPVGNVLIQPLGTIWNNDVLQSLRSIEEHIKGKCRSCELLYSCRGGCRGEAFFRTKDLYNEDDICWLR